MSSPIWNLCWLIVSTQYPIPVYGDYCYTSYSSQTYYCSYGCCSYTGYDPCCGRSNTAAIAGSISSIVAIGIIVLIVCLCCRRRRQNQQGAVVAYARPQPQVMTVQSGCPGPMMASQQNAYSAMPGFTSQQAPSTWNQQTPPAWPQTAVPSYNTQPPPYQPNTAPPLYKTQSSGSYIHPVQGGPAAPRNAGGYINEGMGDGYGDYRIKEIRQNPVNASPMNDGYEEPMTLGYEVPVTPCYEEPDTSRYEPVSSRSQENEYHGLNFERET